MKVFLIGFMASGKTTLAESFSKWKKIRVYDLDNIIEKYTGSKVHEIFSAKGEDSFRQLEKYQLENFKFNDKSVISVGGGAACCFENMKIMNKIGKTVYLKTNQDILHQRLIKDNNRPLVSYNKNSLKKFIKTELKSREKYYKLANYTLNCDNVTLTQLTKKLESLYEKLQN